MSRLAGFYARISPHVAHRPGSARAAQTHAWLIRRTGGRLGGRTVGAEVLVLRTVGRRSGKPRDAPVFFVSHGEGFAVMASNAASTRIPAWWFNLQEHPEADALVRRRTHSVRARAADPQEAEELWPRFVELYSGFEHYKSIATREMPVVILEPR